MRIRIQLLGGFAVEVDGRRVGEAAWRLRKAEAIVKLLALAPGHSLHTDALLDALWPGLDPDAATNNLQYTLHSARRAIDPGWRRGSPLLPRVEDRLLLARDVPIETDVEQFEAAVAAARAAPAPAAFETALALYPGDLLPEDRAEPWTQARREALRGSWLAAMAALGAARVERGEGEAGEATYRRLIEIDPAREAAHVALMRLYAQRGDRAAVAGQYDALTAALRVAHGAEPAERSRQLAEAIAAGRFPPPRQPPRRRDNLPHPLTSFVGRAAALAEVSDLVRRSRLVTLTGSGGAGKTRLAVEVGRRRLTAEPPADGIWLVELAAIQSAALLPQLVAEVLGVREQGHRPLRDTLRDALRPRAMLLILDNAEHLVEAAAGLVRDLLDAAAGLHCLVTSRRPLGLADETLWRVPSLALPAPVAADAPRPRPRPARPGLRRALPAGRAAEAVQLFVERAQAVNPAFMLTPEQSGVVAEICRRLDGMPLAIELAAARARALSVAELAERLDDRFALLAQGNRAAPPRQQTLRGAIAWSYELLSPGEQTLLDRLTVFADGFAPDAASRVATEPAAGGPATGPAGLDVGVPSWLQGLADHSLVQRDGVEATARWRLQESIREFGQARLAAAGDLPATLDRHFAYFLELAERAEPELQGPAQEAWFDRLAAEHANLRVALAWGERRDPGEPVGVLRWLRLAGALGWFWGFRGFWSEGRRWLGAALAAADALPDGSNHELTAARAKALTALGNIAREQGDYPEAQAHLEAGLALARAVDDADGITWAMHNLGLVVWRRGDLARAAALLEATLRRYDALGERWRRATALGNLGTVVNQQGDRDRGIALLAESMLENRALGIKVQLGRALNNLGEIYRQHGDYARAEALYEECLAAWRATGNTGGVSYVLHNLAHTARARGDLIRATELFQSSLSLRWELGERRGVAMCLVGLAGLAARAAVTVRGDADAALARSARLFGAALALLGSLGASMDPADRADNERSMAAVRSRLGDDAYAAAHAAGAAMSLADAVAEALALDADPSGATPEAPAVVPLVPPLPAEPTPRLIAADGRLLPNTPVDPRRTAG